jgi:GNAT superfamily N-acetyltransferase
VTLVIARGGVADVAEAHRMICEVAEWLIAKGEALWGANETSLATLEEVALADELVMGRVAGEAAACMFLHRTDPDFWPGDPGGEAVYIHRLAVARAFHGRGFSGSMLAWAEDEARRTGCRFVRLDCEPRPKLMGLYRAAGYVPVDPGPVIVQGHAVIRQQKPV